MWDLSSLTRDPTLPLAVEAWSLNHGTVIFLVLTVLLSGKDSWFVIPVCVDVQDRWEAMKSGRQSRRSHPWDTTLVVLRL